MSIHNMFSWRNKKNIDKVGWVGGGGSALSGAMSMVSG